jgi:RNA polymerase sigma factor (TIGR02999 family)
VSPSADPSEEVTGLLRAWRRGDDRARDALIDRVYSHLRRLASAQLRHERAGHSFAATDLVHEAYLRLIDQTRVDWRDRAHFFGLAATTMRRVLVDRARRRGRKKRGADALRSGLTIAAAAPLPAPEVDLLDLDRALERLAAESPRAARVVEMRWFAGLEILEIGELLEISPATVSRDWEFARAWMQAELGGMA